MNNLSKTSKLFLFLFIVALIFWIGSYSVRLFQTYQMFVGTEFQLKNYINETNLSGILIALTPVVIVQMITYCLMIIFYFLFFFTCKIKLKENGWLFISLVLVIILLPFEIYLMTIDNSLIQLFYAASYDANYSLSLIIKRFKVLGSFPLIHILSGLTILYLIFFKPLTQKIKNEN